MKALNKETCCLSLFPHKTLHVKSILLKMEITNKKLCLWNSSILSEAGSRSEEKDKKSAHKA